MSSGTPHSTSGAGGSAVHDSASWIGIVAYITIIGWVVALVAKQTNAENNTDFNRFHVRQSLGLMLASLVLMVVGQIPLIGWLLAFLGWIALFVLWILGLVGAAQKKQEPLPVVGEPFQEWFQAL